MQTYKNLVEPNLARAQTSRLDEIRALDDARIEANAKQYAASVRAAWHSKIIDKMVEVDSTTVEALDVWSFRITGRSRDRSPPRRPVHRLERLLGCPLHRARPGDGP
jgi:hypothetical protein